MYEIVEIWLFISMFYFVMKKLSIRSIDENINRAKQVLERIDWL